MKFIERLTNWMIENNIKQVDIAEEANVSKGYVSNVINGKSSPSKKLLLGLKKMSGKSINWWLHGKEEYDNLNSLNELLDFFIGNGSIEIDGSMDEETKTIIYTMLEKEIRVKLEKKKAQQNLS